MNSKVGEPPLNPAKPELHELRRVQVIADYQFGNGARKAFPPTILITRSPHTHKIRYIYLEGKLLATLRAKDGFLALTVEGGKALKRIFKPPRLRVKVIAGVGEFIRKGGNVFAKHVRSADPKIRPGEEVLVVDTRDRLLAVGRTFFNAKEMLSFTMGVAVKVRHGVDDP